MIEMEARAGGLAGFGICTAAPFPQVRTALEERKSSGKSAAMSFTFANPETSTDVHRSFPWARRLVVGAWGYLPEAGSPGPARAGTGRLARFATEDHYVGLRRALDAVAAVLTDEGLNAQVLVDDNRLVDRAAAVRAGVGWWGKNSMVLAPGLGPWLLIGSVVTDAELEVSEPMARDCGSCSACLPACPTGALVAPGVLDAARCLAYWAQAPGVIPVELREAMGDRIYGCDDCLDACPPGQRLVESARAPNGRVDLTDLLADDDRSLLDRFSHFYIPRRQVRHLRRNALVALGNNPERGSVGVVAGYLGHPDWLLRLHAAWALRRMGGSAAAAALRRQAEIETDSRVLEELP